MNLFHHSSIHLRICTYKCIFKYCNKKHLFCIFYFDIIFLLLYTLLFNTMNKRFEYFLNKHSTYKCIFKYCNKKHLFCIFYFDIIFLLLYTLLFNTMNKRFEYFLNKHIFNNYPRIKYFIL